MRKVFFGFAAISLIMLATSCSNETVEVNTDLGNVLAFKAATGKQTLTRASEANLATLKDEGVKVYSYRATDNSFYNEYDLVFNAGSWEYGVTPEYHPLTHNLNHFSVYPSDVDMTNTSGVVTLEDYTVADVDQVDLMVASDITTPTDGTAILTYKHILSQVNFAIQGMDGLIVEVNDIKLSGIYSTGTYTFSTGWDNLSNFVEYVYNPITYVTTGTVNEGTVYMGNTGDGPEEGYRNNSNDNALMLLPQALDDNAKLTFSFQFENSPSGESVSVQLNKLDVTEWEASKRYLYKLIFDPVLLVFEIDVVEDWIDYDNAGGIIDVETVDYD